MFDGGAILFPHGKKGLSFGDYVVMAGEDREAASEALELRSS